MPKVIFQLWGKNNWFNKNTGIAHQSEWLPSKSLQAVNAGEGVEKREPSCTVGGNAN